VPSKVARRHLPPPNGDGAARRSNNRRLCGKSSANAATAAQFSSIQTLYRPVIEIPESLDSQAIQASWRKRPALLRKCPWGEYPHATGQLR
jgi:hypothetical protein